MEMFIKQHFDMNAKFSTKKLLTFVKMVKPVVKFLRKRARTNAVTPSACNYDVVESAQNDANESELLQLHFKFLEDVTDATDADEFGDNWKNEMLERRLLRTVGPGAVVDASGAVRCPPPDSDVCCLGGACFTGRQTAECQAPAPRAAFPDGASPTATYEIPRYPTLVQ